MSWSPFKDTIKCPKCTHLNWASEDSCENCKWDLDEEYDEDDDD